MKLLLLLCIFASIHISTQIPMVEKICIQPSKLLSFWNCLLNNLPRYYKNHYLRIANCIKLVKEITNIYDALAYFTCSEEIDLEDMKECLNNYPSSNVGTPSRNDERETDYVFGACFKQSYE
ncbi:uncharacterized protein [Centruroides vittatus]|uniref:uncharacterized protein n=1 Tax=Centruroides vittatus TaxID=120091 RepID=UPI0035106762